MTLRVVVDKVKAFFHIKKIVSLELNVPNARLLLQRGRGNESGGRYINPSGMESQLSGD